MATPTPKPILPPGEQSRAFVAEMPAGGPPDPIPVSPARAVLETLRDDLMSRHIDRSEIINRLNGALAELR